MVGALDLPDLPQKCKESRGSKTTDYGTLRVYGNITDWGSVCQVIQEGSFLFDRTM